MRQLALFSNILPVLFGNPVTFAAGVAVRLITAWAGIKAKRVNKCAPYFPIPYAGYGPAMVQGFGIPVEEHWPTPWTFRPWTMWDAFDLWCSNLRDAVAAGRRIALPVLTPAQRAIWSQIRGGTLWLSSGRVVASSQTFSRTSVGFSAARQARLVRF